jgi:hypothetical protein
LFCISVSFFFLRFSILWTTSSLTLSIFILNSFNSIYVFCFSLVFICGFYDFIYLFLCFLIFFIFVLLEFLECLLYVLVDHV